MSLLRGLALVNDLTVIRRLYGEDPVARFAARLTPEQRREFDRGFLPGRWYDEDIQARMCQVLSEMYDEPALFRLGVAIASHHVSRTQRFLARIAGPKRLLARAAALWSYWRDSGYGRVEAEQENQADLVLYDHPIMATPGYALIYGGACCYLLSLAGARDVKMRVDVKNPLRIVVRATWAPASASESGAFSVDSALASLGASGPSRPRKSSGELEQGCGTRK